MNEEYSKCISMLDKNEIISFLSDLIKLESFPPEFNEKRVALAIQNKLMDYGIESAIDDLNNLEGVGRVNIFASIGSASSPHLSYSGHLDTVPPLEEGWRYGPFSAEIIDGKMYGRGAVDMKAGVTAMVMALCILKKSGIKLNGKLSFLGTAGEEVGCQGARLYREKYGAEDIDALAISEASNKKIFLAEKGALWIKFTSYGVSAHPGVAQEGINALFNMLKFYEVFRNYKFKIDNHKLLGNSNLNITTMQAGSITNALPIKCVSTVDIRTVPGVNNQDILSEIEKIIHELKCEDEKFNMEYEVINDFIPIETDIDNPFVKTALNTHEEVFGTKAIISGVHYFTDAVEIAKYKQIPLIIYGPGNPIYNHKINENVELEDVIGATKYYIGLALNYLK